jgi:FkbM family methyltransferase
MPVSREEVCGAYRLLLGREPESEDVIAAHQAEPDIDSLGRRLLRSEEFRRRLVRETASANAPKWVCTEIPHGLRLWVDLSDAGVSAGCLQGNWEPTETDLILSLLSPGDTFIDVGANIGWFTLLAAHAVGGSGKVYAFEPRTDRRARLEQSIAENGFETRCVVEAAALGTTACDTTLGWVPSERNPGHSFIMPSAPIEGAETIETISVRALDSFNIPGPVRLIKIDVEGAEPQAIAGAMELITRDRPILLLELFPQWLSAVSNITTLDFVNRLRGFGYRVHRLAKYGIGRELFSGDDGIESGGPEYFSVVAMSEADRNCSTPGLT